MSSILHNGPDVATFAANLVVFFGAIAAAVAGALHAAKTIKKSWAEMAKSSEAPVEKTTTATQVVGGLLQDAYGSAMLAEQLRGLREAMEGLVAATKENTREVNEARHATERLMDRMDRRNG